MLKINLLYLIKLMKYNNNKKIYNNKNYKYNNNKIIYKYKSLNNNNIKRKLNKLHMI